MIKNMNLFEERFKKLRYQTTIPDMTQTLSEEKLIKIISKYDGWIVGDDPATDKVLKSGKKGKLKALVKWGIGVDNIDIDACKRLEIKFSNTPDIFGDEVADIAIGYMIALSRNTFLIDREIRKGNWVKPTGSSLKGKTVGILGLGDIGKNVAKRSKVLGYGIDYTSKIYKQYKNAQKTRDTNEHWSKGLIFAKFFLVEFEGVDPSLL